MHEELNTIGFPERTRQNSGSAQLTSGFGPETLVETTLADFCRRHLPELMTETELMHFLRIPDVSHGANPRNVVENLKRFHQLPCIHISRQPLYPLSAVRRWVEEKLAREGAV